MKKYLFLALASTLGLTGFSQRFTLSGTAPKDAKTVVLDLFGNHDKISIEVAADGTFRHSGDAEGYSLGRAYADNNEREAIPVVLDGVVSLDFHRRLSAGTAENSRLSEVMAYVRPNIEALSNIDAEATRLQGEGKLEGAVLDSLRTVYEEATMALVGQVREVCNDNQDALFPALFLVQCGSLMEKDDLVRWSDADAAFMKAKVLERLRNNIEGWRRQAVGTLFTDLTLPDTEGREHKLSEYVGKGQYVLVDFWASWCGPCMRELPNVKECYEKYHAKGFDIVGLSFDNDAAAWKSAIEKKGLTWHHLSDLKGWGSIAASTYGINSIPATILFDPEGRVAATNLRDEALRAKLKEIFE